jgi:hypothetical protein
MYKNSQQNLDLNWIFKIKRKENRKKKKEKKKKKKRIKRRMGRNVTSGPLNTSSPTAHNASTVALTSGACTLVTPLSRHFSSLSDAWSRAVTPHQQPHRPWRDLVVSSGGSVAVQLPAHKMSHATSLPSINPACIHQRIVERERESRSEPVETEKAGRRPHHRPSRSAQLEPCVRSGGSARVLGLRWWR